MNDASFSGALRAALAGQVRRTSPSKTITIGLVNNMPEAALRQTERQFLGLLSGAVRECAARGLQLRLPLFHLPGLERGEEASAYLRARYAPTQDLPGAGIDALIVTGAEPRRASLSDEPYWHDFAQLIDWAEHNTVSTIWSCLAAHAAVLHLDGIERRRLATKMSGVFELNRASDHPLFRGASRAIHVPHSRYNDLPERELVQHGYQILARSDDVGADTFVKDGPSLFVFLQGHPEYERDTLHREYRRDVARFLNAERDSCPMLPTGYYGPADTQALTAFAEAAVAERRPDLSRRFPRIGAGLHPVRDWRAGATRFYANWLDYVAEAKSRRSQKARDVVS